MITLATLLAIFASGCAPSAPSRAPARAKGECTLGRIQYYERSGSGLRWDDSYCLLEAVEPPEESP